ncbi:MAG: calpastatin [Rhodospirillales bacterium]|nr:calpastatin [Rhodospirillales bacterium]
MNAPYDLQRFVDAQEAVFEQVLAELSRGRKHSHWIWFIFPQIAGLGRSPMAQKYAISSMGEAEAYLRHAMLGPRLEACTQLVNRVEGRSITDILGYPDDLKFRSSMTLFARAAPNNAIFGEALRKYFNGEGDQQTLNRLPG